MAKKKVEEVKPLEITSAVVVDDFCNYSYNIMHGTGRGNTHNVKGKGIISPDMGLAFSRLNVHMAIMDDTFMHSGREIIDVDSMHGDDITLLYMVRGIKIKGTAEDESVVLIGSKFVSSSSGRIELETPKISLVGVGGYEFKEHLKAAVDAVRFEVEQYHNGKYTEVEVIEAVDKNQKSIFDKDEDQNFDDHKV